MAALLFLFVEKVIAFCFYSCYDCIMFNQALGAGHLKEIEMANQALIQAHTEQFFVSAELADWLSSQSFYEWQASAGYDTRPYYRTSNGGRALPVAHTVECVDRCEAVEYEGDPVALLATIQTLHALGVEIVVPDYSGCSLEGETRWTPSDYGAWVQSYESFRD